jgi:tryptophanase
MFGKQPDGIEKAAHMDLVQLAIPRRTHTHSHADYITEIFAELADSKDNLTGYKITKQPDLMRHFTCYFAPLC